MRDKIQSLIIEMLAHHKDLQHLPNCEDLVPYLEAYFQIPERGSLSRYGTYTISTKGVTVVLWANSRFNYSWATITPRFLAVHTSNQQLLF